jgi:hypothetical protein
MTVGHKHFLDIKKQYKNDQVSTNIFISLIIFKSKFIF